MEYSDLDITRAKLLGSLILFTRVFYKIRTGREFLLSTPDSRESHYMTICKSLVKVFRGEIKRLIINVPPRYGKTELLIHFCAWALARWPDSNFLYVSYSHSLAKKQTKTIRQIVTLRDYSQLFDVMLSADSSAQDNFETNMLGSVYAAGAGGTITGRGAGIQGINRFGGCIVIDDIHKPSEVTSDVMRQSVNEWYLNTLQSRVNDPRTPIIFIGQRLHEDDLPANLIKGFDSYQWETVILPAMDIHDNALLPAMHTKEQLLLMKEKMPYEFSSQYQQSPQPSGGGIFKPEWFVLLDSEPEISCAFITADTAETEKTYNDATVFSFWGLYKIQEFGHDTDVYALHWIDCWELWCEPKDLMENFKQFYTDCLRYKVKPSMVAIEKKSSGTTLLSMLKDMRGVNVIDIERPANAGSKTQRFLEAQPYIASKLISFNENAKHTKSCIEHMRKITANNTHRYDDIADTCADAIKIGLIDKIVKDISDVDNEEEEVLSNLVQHTHQYKDTRANLWRR